MSKFPNGNEDYIVDGNLNRIYLKGLTLTPDHTLVDTDDNDVNLGTGATGPQGVQGPSGLNGAQGPQGPMGEGLDCCDDILLKLDEIEGMLVPQVKIVEVIKVVKEPVEVIKYVDKPVIITKTCTKYVTKNNDRVVYISDSKPKVIEPIKTTIQETFRCDFNDVCLAYEYRLRQDIEATRIKFKVRPDSKPWDKWTRTNYELFRDQSVDLGRPPGCLLEIEEKVFMDLFGSEPYRRLHHKKSMV